MSKRIAEFTWNGVKWQIAKYRVNEVILIRQAGSNGSGTPLLSLQSILQPSLIVYCEETLRGFDPIADGLDMNMVAGFPGAIVNVDGL